MPESKSHGCYQAFLHQELWDLGMGNSEVPFGVEKANTS